MTVSLLSRSTALRRVLPGDGEHAVHAEERERGHVAAPDDVVDGGDVLALVVHVQVVAAEVGEYETKPLPLGLLGLLVLVVLLAVLGAGHRALR